MERINTTIELFDKWEVLPDRDFYENGNLSDYSVEVFAVSEDGYNYTLLYNYKKSLWVDCHGDDILDENEDFKWFYKPKELENIF